MKPLILIRAPKNRSDSKPVDLTVIVPTGTGFWRGLRVVFLFAVWCTPILIGLWAGSAALQWVGYLIGILLVVAVVSIRRSKNHSIGTSFDDARAKLNEIERRLAAGKSDIS